MKTKYIRYKRIIYHLILMIFTNNKEHLFEIQHYYYMKSFKNSINLK